MTDVMHLTDLPPSAGSTIKLDNGRTILQTEYIAVLTAVNAFIPTMLPGHSYLVETMLGQAIWGTPLKWHAGAIVAHAVRRGKLPLRFAHNGKKATKLYELIT